MSLRIRLRVTKSLLRRTERFCFGLGIVCMGLCAAILVQLWFFQAYENWAFDQGLGAEPASLAGLGAPTAPLSAAATSIAPPADRGKVETLGFQSYVDSSVVGRIEIPRIGLKAIILEGVAQRTLALAVGHITGTALPGRTGNVGLAGHRDTFFRSLHGVRSGDTIVLTTIEGSYEYRIKSCEVVGPGETRVLEDSAEPMLTLVTCYPFHYIGPAPSRFIVHAARVAG